MVILLPTFAFSRRIHVEADNMVIFILFFLSIIASSNE